MDFFEGNTNGGMTFVWREDDLVPWHDTPNQINFGQSRWHLFEKFYGVVLENKNMKIKKRRKEVKEKRSFNSHNFLNFSSDQYSATDELQTWISRGIRI